MPKPQDKTPTPRSPGSEIDPVFIWPTPNHEDLLFWVEKSGDLPKNKTWQYGDPFWDAVKYPDHKLVYVTPQTPDKWSRWYYASDRLNEGAYNFQDDQGQRLTRSYIVPRADYLDRVAYLASLPTVGTADATFTQYVFAGESEIRLESPLDGLYVGVERYYLPPVKTDIEFDQTLERNVVVTRTIIPHGTGAGAASAGSITEVQDVNTWYDIEVKRELEGLGGITFPVQLDTVPVDVPFRLPPKLNTVVTHAAGALADSDSAARSMSEDFAFDYNMTDPMDGPYQGRLLRFLTDDPSALIASYPQFRVNAARETLFIGRAWFYASQKGNSTHAQTQIIELPRSIHDTLTITPPANPYGALQIVTSSLAATPNYAAIIAGGYKTIGYDPKKAPLKLWIVDIVQMNFTGIYA